MDCLSTHPASRIAALLLLSVLLLTLVTPSHQTSTFSTSLFSSPKGAACPSNARQRAQACVAKLAMLQPMGAAGGNSASLGKMLEAGCYQGDLLDAVNCLERVMLDCRHSTTDEAHYLRSNIDVEKTRSTVIYFCNNIQTYVSNLDCIQENQMLAIECVHEAKTRFEAQVTATENKDALMRFQCPLYRQTVSCFQSVLREACNADISDIVYTVMAGVKPPICGDQGYQVGNSGSSTTPYLAAVGLWLAVALVTSLWQFDVRW